MLEAIKLVMTLNGAFNGYKTYIGAAFTIMAAFSGWGLAVLMPFLDGGMGMSELVANSTPYFVAMGVGFSQAGQRKAMK